MTLLKLSKVQKHFQGQLALDIPHFEADQGEIIALVGANGAGKSTFIKLVSGLILQDRGQVRVGDQPNTSPKIHHQVKFVLESGRGYYDYLTANQNLTYFLHLNRLTRTEVAGDLDRLCQLLDFSPHLDTLVADLSQGSRQKLSLIIALLCQPRVLCLDEPTNGLDVVAKKQFARLLVELSQTRNTLILLTCHDMFFIKEVATRILVINQGKIKKEGQFQDIFGQDRDWKTYRIAIAKSEQAVFARLFPQITYQEREDSLLVDVTDKATKTRILQQVEVLQVDEVTKSIEDILYEVIRHD